MAKGLFTLSKLSIVVLLLFMSISISGQDYNWQNHKMTSDDVIQMGSEYKLMSVDDGIMKFINDLEYLPKLFPLLMKSLELPMGVNKKTLVAPPLFADTEDIESYLKDRIVVNQYFTSLRDDTLAVELHLQNNDNNGLINIEKTNLVKAFADGNEYVDFFYRSKDIKAIALSSMLDSVDISVDLDITTEMDTLGWDKSLTEVINDKDTIQISRVSATEIYFECSTSVYDKILDYVAYNSSAEKIVLDSILTKSPIVDFNYKNSMLLLDEFLNLRNSMLLDIDSYQNNDLFRSSLDSILSKFELSEVEDRYKVKLIYAQSVDKIDFYLKGDEKKETLDWRLSLKRY